MDSGKEAKLLSKNYTAYHVHSELSLLDSATKFQDYIDRAVQLGQTAIAFTEHGNMMKACAQRDFDALPPQEWCRMLFDRAAL